MILSTFYDHILELAKQEELRPSDALRLVQALGINHVDVILREGDLPRTQQINEVLEAADFSVASVCAFMDLTGQHDGTVPEAGLLALDMADILGSRHVMLIPGFHTETDTQEEQDTKTRNMIAGIQSLVPIAKQRGITLLMESFDDRLAPYGTLAQLLRFYEQIPELMAAFDSGNFIYSQEDMLTAYEALRTRIRQVHVKDRDFDPTGAEAKGHPKQDIGGRPMYPVAVGGGDLPIAKLLGRLRTDGYDGTITIEHFDHPNMLEALTRSAGFLRSYTTANPSGS